MQPALRWNLSGLRRGHRGLLRAAWSLALLVCGAAHANVVTDVNTALLGIIQNTSVALVSGPPQAAREIALIEGAMFDAVNATSGSPYPYLALPSVGWTGIGASGDAAALQAALVVMNSLYGQGSIYQQYQGVTGAAFYPTIPGYAAALVGPTAAQMKAVAAQIAAINARLAALGNSRAVTAGIALGTRAGNAMLALGANDGGYAASLQTLTPYVPPNAGAPGVYVPPGGRPAMAPTWGSVQPLVISSVTLNALQSAVPPAYASTPQGLQSQAYALEVLQTECLGSGVGLPSTVQGACSAAGFVPESAAEAQAALFWNDPGGSLLPPGHWLQIANTVSIQKRLDLLHTARATASVGLALHAAGIGAWAIKYQPAVWRPVTAIQDCAGWSPSWFTSCYTGWSSLIATPPHPDYLAGHPAFSGAAATALATAIGTDRVNFVSTSVSYCNVGAATRNSLGHVTSCTFNGATYSLPVACADGATAVYDGDPSSPALVACTLGGVAQTMTGGGCNNAGSQPVLNADYTANPAYNASPLICVIAEPYSSLSQASSGSLGAEFSRVSGGIHTPAAVMQGRLLGSAIGAYVLPSNFSLGQRTCNGNYSGVLLGSLTVSAGQNCVLSAPCQITGNVTVNGGSLVLGCSIGGSLTISGSSSFSVNGAWIGKDLRIQSLTAGASQGSVCGSKVQGDLVVQNSAGPVVIGARDTDACAGNKIGDDLLAYSNAGALTIDNNSVRDNLQVYGNRGATEVYGNDVNHGFQTLAWWNWFQR